MTMILKTRDNLLQLNLFLLLTFELIVCVLHAASMLGLLRFSYIALIIYRNRVVVK